MSFTRWHRERGQARQDEQRGYDPNQPRWPEGTPIAGQWMDIPGLGDDVPVMFGGSAMDKVDLTEDDPRNEVEVIRMLNRQKNDFEALPGSARVWVFHGGRGGSGAGSAREHTYVTMNPYLAARFSKDGEVRAYSVVKQDMEPTPEALRVDGVNTTAESLFDTGEAMVRRDLTGEAILLDREKRIPDQLREAVAKPPAPTTPVGPGPGSDQLPSAQPGGEAGEGSLVGQASPNVPIPPAVNGGHLFGANALGGGTDDDTRNQVTDALWGELEAYQHLPDNAPVWVFYAGEHAEREGLVPVSVSPHAIARTSDDVRVARVRKANIQAGDGTALLGGFGETIGESREESSAALAKVAE